MRPIYIKKTISGTIFDILNTLFIVFFIFIMVYPFYNQLILSLNEGMDARFGGIYFWPRKFTLENYTYMITNSNLGKGVLISILRVVVGTVTTILCSGMLAYVTTVKWFSGWRFLRVIFLITMYFSGGLIPTYLWYINLKLLNTFWVYILPGLFNSYFMLLIAAYMYNLPEALAESARLDGAREITIYLRIMVPLCVPVFAAVAVFSAVGHWNSWFDVMIYNPSGNWDTLQMHLRRILLGVEQLAKLQNESQQREAIRKLTPTSVRAATTMIVTLPIVFSYPFLQRYFISGISIGAIKG